MLEKFNAVGVANLEIYGKLHETSLRMYTEGGQMDQRVDGLYGTVEPGKYRAIVILQRVGALQDPGM